MKGGAEPPAFAGFADVFWSWLGSAVGIGLCAWLSSQWLESRDMTLIIGSFGASAVLVYAYIGSPLAQPRNLVGGHMLSAIVGVFCFKIFGEVPWLAASLAVSLAIAAMLFTRTLHPPGGATALIAVVGSDVVHKLGFFYVLVPAGLGALILLSVALVTNNLASSRRYPKYWF